MKRFQKLEELLTKLVRPGTFPIAVRLFKEEPESLPEGTVFPLASFGNAICFCQGFGLVRRYGWKVGFRFEDNACPFYLIFFGMEEQPQIVTEGNMCYPYFTETLELGALAEASLTKIPLGIVKMSFMEPLDANLVYEPDLVLVYGNAAQMNKLIAAANYHKGSGIEGGPFTARGSCSSSIAKPFLTKDYRVNIPGGGERVSGHTLDDELVFTIPKEKVEEIISGLEATDSMGIGRIPVHYKGFQVQPTFPDKYNELAKVFGVTTKARRE